MWMDEKQNDWILHECAAVSYKLQVFPMQLSPIHRAKFNEVIRNLEVEFIYEELRAQTLPLYS